VPSNLRRLIIALGCTALIAAAIALPLAAGGEDSTGNAAETQYGEGEGCTPGYWKKHTGTAVWGTTYSPTGSYFDEVFGVGPHITLLQALETGGGGFNALGRHAVAALLNADNSSIGYEFDIEEIIALVNQAYSSGEPEQIKDEFESFTDANASIVCPINANGEVTG
jgi:hypothetical protein